MISALSTLERSLASLGKARASFYAFVNIHFMELPDEEFASALRKEEFCSVLKDLEQSSENHPEIVEGASLMQAYVFETRALDDRQFAERLGVDRTRLYRGGSPNGDPTPPYESLWTGKDQDSVLLQEIARIYMESGFALRADIHERIDYIGIQLNYLERVVMREVSAREAGDKKEIQMTLDHERNFIRDHLGNWVPSFVLSALDHAQTNFYRGHLHMLKGFIEQEKETITSMMSLS
jgi:putative dimethyl sulfoxide reductase chaperone